LIATLRERRAHLARFALSGATAGLLQLLLLQVLSSFGWPRLVGNAVAFLVATQANFCLGQWFTWRDRSDASRSLARRWATYHGSVAVTAVLNMVVFAVASTALPELLAAALGIVAASVANFVSGDLLVFRTAPPSSSQSPRAAPPRLSAHSEGRAA
jgi:putative flippase GtrA